MSHHYVQYESLNRYVFSRLLNPVTVLDDRMSTGRLFRAFGRATAKAQLPNLTRVLGTRRLPRATERSDRRVDMVVTGMHHPTSLTCHVSDVGWCETVCGLAHQQTQLECYSLCDAEPMQVVAQQRSDVVAASAIVYDSSGAVQDELQLVSLLLTAGRK